MSTDKRPTAGRIPADQLQPKYEYFKEYEITINGAVQDIDGNGRYTLDNTSPDDALAAFAAWQGYESIAAMVAATGKAYTAVELHMYEISANEVHMGIFYGTSEADALDRYATEAGYKDFRALQSEQPGHVTINRISQYL
jgi:hypothetical protein